MLKFTHVLCLTISLAVSGLVLSACAGAPSSAKYMIPYVGGFLALKDMDDNQKKMKLSQMIVEEPDLPAWKEAREKIMMGVGDRVVSKDVGNTFKSLLIGIASLEVTVDNAEKDSGFISCKGKVLPPDIAAALRKQRMVEYAEAKGLPARSAEPTTFYNPATVSSIMEEATTMTITVQEHGTGQSKVKIRFNNIYYPQELEESYRLVWLALDKQGFLDEALDKTSAK